MEDNISFLGLMAKENDIFNAFSSFAEFVGTEVAGLQLWLACYILGFV